MTSDPARYEAEVLAAHQADADEAEREAKHRHALMVLTNPPGDYERAQDEP